MMSVNLFPDKTLMFNDSAEYWILIDDSVSSFMQFFLQKHCVFQAHQDLNCVNMLNPADKLFLFPLCTFLLKSDSPSHLLPPRTWTSSVRQTWTNLFIHSKLNVCVCVCLCVCATWHSSMFLLGSFIGGIKISSAPKQVSWSVLPFPGIKTPHYEALGEKPALTQFFTRQPQLRLFSNLRNVFADLDNNCFGGRGGDNPAANIQINTKKSAREALG